MDPPVDRERNKLAAPPLAPFVPDYRRCWCHLHPQLAATWVIGDANHNRFRPDLCHCRAPHYGEGGFTEPRCSSRPDRGAQHPTSIALIDRRAKRRQDGVLANYSVNPDAIAHARWLVGARRYVLRSRWADLQPRPPSERLRQVKLAG
jgi:hypothetical protein